MNAKQSIRRAWRITTHIQELQFSLFWTHPHQGASVWVAEHNSSSAAPHHCTYNILASHRSFSKKFQRLSSFTSAKYEYFIVFNQNAKIMEVRKTPTCINRGKFFFCFRRKCSDPKHTFTDFLGVGAVHLIRDSADGTWPLIKRFFIH